MSRRFTATITHWKAYPDGSGTECLIDVWLGRQSARFTLSIMGSLDRLSVDGLGSGLTCRQTHRAADFARDTYRRAVVERCSAEWLAKNAALFAATESEVA